MSEKGPASEENEVEKVITPAGLASGLYEGWRLELYAKKQTNLRRTNVLRPDGLEAAQVTKLDTGIDLT